MTIVKGVEVAEGLKQQMMKDIESLGDVKPTLGIVRIGAKPGDLSYEKGVRKTAESVGLEVKTFELPEDIAQEEFDKEFMKVNDDPTVHGILLFRPLPAHLSDANISRMINPDKDMDCMSPINFAKLAMGDESGYYPCTPEAVMKIVDHIGIDCQGKNVVIIGHSLVVGRPLGYLMIARNASVSWCHVFTKDTIKRCEDADIIIAAAGVPGLVKRAHVEKAGKDCVVIDVGINFVDGKMCGDVAFDEVAPLVGYITPVPGGVGGVTNTVMASHVVRAALKAVKGNK
ncbi:bifunctional 5,10-methylenetetrahydrofolate dehydrogenase/5,10-methenyltetrahydrofolate cyclohydrolase [Parasporobacterium paucivorans]|uniref:Bifunctional protein FolD n=1 Tax=Parasporobacterium paucivorans DSM 15970 TaxID=1122934 RepID=A0A1M6G9J3_9FIRM|nr:bifunctional 5,10-methylenetetrahydrofolate dehydrogenase/5,10-methenyltetrahydrofolate cyclohydrolase [Parasporobacterium paucivorans]SHJ06589.1 methenyltetrahydrofolate cyclohydrolase [Parasporobacterium paucivorans DSM 15970]